MHAQTDKLNVNHIMFWYFNVYIRVERDRERPIVGLVSVVHDLFGQTLEVIVALSQIGAGTLQSPRQLDKMANDG